MITAKVKYSAGTRIVIMPKHAAFPAYVNVVKVIIEANERILRPCNSTWDDFFQSTATDDFCDERSSQEQSEREQF